APVENTLPAKGSLHASGELPASFKIDAHEVQLSPETEVQVLAAEHGRIELALTSGKATFDVQRVEAGEVFRVKTEHVLVEVVGTRCSVQSKRAGSTVTVDEGRVPVSDTVGAVIRLTPKQQRRFCPGANADYLLRQALVLISGSGSLDEAV